MKYRAILTRRAVQDIDEAYAWYEHQGQTLGNKFKSDVIDTIDTIIERPLSFPEAAKGARGSRCDRFPYKIYFRVQGSVIRILAVYHLSRDPNLWNDPDR